MDSWEAVTLHGGPLDGYQAVVSPADHTTGISLTSPHSQYGPAGKSWYRPDPEGVWRWIGDTP
ncbi:hypothetical protein [Kitasatospora sp. NPDC057738]|uniref:hypothetical protein n=1 Tax=Kitasatospora sp. NPDC057738 TaxID=3346233 RepID=UPI0036999104